MPQEIERKFLVHAQKWENAPKPEGQFLRQGYLVTDPEKTIRVRLAGDRGFLTIKGKNAGATRAEFEYEIPKHEAEELLDRFAVSDLTKIRYTLPVDGKIWEVDIFLGKNEGLIVAEIELSHKDESFTSPDWLGLEVTDDARYYNSNLSIHPFLEW